LCRTTLPLAQLSRTFVAVQSDPRNDFNRCRDEVIAAPAKDQEIYVEIARAITLKLLNSNMKYK
jgi:hypothetical protein